MERLETETSGIIVGGNRGDTMPRQTYGEEGADRPSKCPSLTPLLYNHLLCGHLSLQRPIQADLRT